MWTQSELIVWIQWLGVWSLVGRSSVLCMNVTPHWITDVLMWAPAKGMCKPRELFRILQAQALELYRAVCVQEFLHLCNEF